MAKQEKIELHIYKSKSYCNAQTSEEKIKVLDNMISNNNKRIKFREDFVKFTPLLVIIHLAIPVITLIGTPIICLIPIPGLLEFLYPGILAFWIYSAAIIITCPIILSARFIMSRTMKGLKNKTNVIKDLKEKVEKERQQEMSPTQDKDSIDVLYTKRARQLNEQKIISRTRIITGTKNDNLQNIQRGLRLVRKPNSSKYTKKII